MDPAGSSLIVVADGRRARLFEERDRGGRLVEVTSRLGDLSVRRPLAGPSHASTHQRVGPASHAGDQPTARDQREAAFARQIGLRAIELMRMGHHQDLVVMAPPRTLGRLRHVVAGARVPVSGQSVDCVAESATAIAARLRRLRLEA